MIDEEPVLSAPTAAMDWPLSREEKKSQIIRLYNEDVRAADSMLSSGEAALEALREELEAVRRAAGVQRLDQDIRDNTPASESELQRLRAAVESASAVLRAILPPLDDVDDDDNASPSFSGRIRARSEGSSRNALSQACLRSSLCRTPRGKSRDGKCMRVSFGSQPEAEAEPNATRFDADTVDSEESSPEKASLRLRLRSAHTSPTKPLRQLEEVSGGDMKKQTSLVTKEGSDLLRVHLAWFAFVCIILAVVVPIMLRWMSQPKVVTLGDPSCWIEGFRPDFCCQGDDGRPECWDQFHTFERCCTPQQAF